MIKMNNLHPSLRSQIDGNVLNGEDYFLVKKASNSYSRIRDKADSANILFSLAEAISAMTENQGDRLFILPEYTETIEGAGGIALNKEGIDIFCMGRYDQRPRFLMDAANTVTMLVTKANIGWYGGIFAAGHEDIAVFATITAKGFHLEGTLFEENVATENWVTVINAGAADHDHDGLEIIDCVFDMVDAASTGCIIMNKDNKDVVIQGNRINGDFGVTTFAPIYMPTAEVAKNILIKDNIIHNTHNGDAAVGISMTCITATGAIIGNHVGHQDADGSTPILGGTAGLYVGENYTSSVLGTASGYLYPAADDGAS